MSSHGADDDQDGADRRDHAGPTTTGSLPGEVAELTGELAEAESASRRKRIARQVAEVGVRRSQAARRGGQSTWRGMRSGGAATLRNAQAGGQAATQRIRRSGPAAGQALRAAGTWLTVQVMEMAPKVPVRDLATLRTQYPGRDTEELANLLISAAARASAGVGASVGAAAAVPFAPTTPVELGVETLALVAIELKLTAELHEVYGMRAAGSAPERMLSYLGAWANRRAIASGGSGVAMAVGTPFRRTLERRLIAKAGQSTLSLAPLFAGAAAGALIDHRETRRLGDRVRADLRKHAAA
jgi:hypothetical protein